MIGGGKKLLKMTKIKTDDTVSLLIAIFVLYIARTYIVQQTYNIMWPKLIHNSTNNKDNNFTPLSFYESFLFVIFIDFLFI
jgi:hypothetical protein